MTKFWRLLKVSAVTLLVVLFCLLIGAIIDITQNEMCGYPDVWRETRHPLGYLTVFLLTINGAILGAARQVSVRSLSFSAVLVLIWVILDPGWPRF